MITQIHPGKEDRLDEALGWFFDAEARGERVSQSEVLTHYPELASEIARFFADEEGIQRLTGSLGGAGTRNSRPSFTPPEQGPPDRIGDYEIQGVLGKGGMGVVYRARQLSAGRIVALKMIQGGGFDSESEQERFLHEAEATAALDHPNIVPIYEVGSIDGRWFFSMKLIPGGSLASQLAAFAGNYRAAARLVGAVARGVHHAHQRGILHRDIKPGNILLSAALLQGATEQYIPGSATEWTPYVTDFGLAKRLESGKEMTQSGTIVGTPEYMAPEQAAARKDLTIAADVYSLGAVLYAVLTGQPPFRGSSILDTLKQVTETEPKAPRSIDRGIDRDLETICLKCLQKEPAARYTSAEALADELDRWSRGEAISARPYGRVERAWRWTRRNRMVASLLMLIASVVLASVIGLSVFSWLLWAESQAKGKESEAKEQALAKAQSDRDLADRRAQIAREALDEVAKAADDWMPRDPALIGARRTVLLNTRKVYEDLLRTNPTDPVLRHSTARALLRTASLLPHDEKVKTLNRALELWQGLEGEFPDQPKYRHPQAEVYLSLAGCQSREEDLFAFRRKEAEVVQKLTEDFPENLDFRDLLAHQRYYLGHTLTNVRRYEEAESIFGKGLEVALKLCREPRTRGSYWKHVATNSWGLGVVFVRTNRRKEGIETLRAAIQVQVELLPKLLLEYRSNYASQLDHAGMRNDLAHALLLEQEWSKADDCLRQTEDLMRVLAKQAPDAQEPLLSLERALMLHAECHHHAGRHHEAVRCEEELLSLKSLTAQRRVRVLTTGVGSAGRSPQEALDLARQLVVEQRTPTTQFLLGVALLQTGEYTRATSELEQSLQGDALPRTGLFLARARYRMGDPERARRHYDLARKHVAADPFERDDPEWRRLEAETADLLGLRVPGHSHLLLQIGGAQSLAPGGPALGPLVQVLAAARITGLETSVWPPPRYHN